jgi:hypothetical protein
VRIDQPHEIVDRGGGDLLVLACDEKSRDSDKLQFGGRDSLNDESVSIMWVARKYVSGFNDKCVRNWKIQSFRIDRIGQSITPSWANAA